MTDVDRWLKGIEIDVAVGLIRLSIYSSMRITQAYACARVFVNNRHVVSDHGTENCIVIPCVVIRWLGILASEISEAFHPHTVARVGPFTGLFIGRTGLAAHFQVR